MKKNNILTSTILVGLIFLFVKGQGFVQAEENEVPLIENLSSADFIVRENAYKKLTAQRQQMISNLLNILKQKGSDPRERMLPEFGSSLELTIRLLGEFRAVEAISELIKIIDYAPLLKEDLPLDRRYPAVRALIEIGDPSIPIVMDELAKTSVPLRSKLCALVIKEIETKDIGEILIENAIKNETDSKRKANLQSVLQYLK